MSVNWINHPPFISSRTHLPPTDRILSWDNNNKTKSKMSSLNFITSDTTKHIYIDIPLKPGAMLMFNFILFFYCINIYLCYINY
jgi:hypothetical protein